jgi:hypothetical protein
MQLIDAGRLFIDMKKEGLSVKDMFNEIAGLGAEEKDS